MILSVSRRTDIPAWYSDWFFHRLKEGFLYVRNPVNPRQVSRVSLSPDVVDCIVFWTKNPKPMLSRLSELDAYPYYFQFTLTGYGKDLEPGVPHKREYMLPVFRELSERIGKERVIWRYDPIFFTDRYTKEYHIHAFEEIAKVLRGHTEKCVISFGDIYAKNRKAMAQLSCHIGENAAGGGEELRNFARALSGIAGENGMRIATCAETIDLSDCGIAHNSCIDKELIEKITGCVIRAGKDKSQRAACGCIESVEVGAYDTCPAGCRYCYANGSAGRLEQNLKNYDEKSPFLCGMRKEGDVVKERRVKRCGAKRK